MISCDKRINETTDKVNYRDNSKIESLFEFPDTVKIGEKNIAKLTFYNRTFDTIIEPRIKGYVQFRFLLFSEYYPENENQSNSRIYADSILLDTNSLKISYQFDEIGNFFIGGLIRDEL